MGHSDGELGEVGQLHPDAASAWGIDQPVYVAELSMDAILKSTTGTKKFSPLPRYPVVQRDLAVVVDKDVENAAVTAYILAAKTDAIIENVTLFDVYAGVGIPEGKKSMAYSFTLRSDDHTLADDEIHAAMDAIITNLAENGAALRA